MSRGFARPLARIGFAILVFVTLAAAIMSREDKWMMDFDQPFYLSIAYDLDRHHVFSNGILDTVDSTVQAPPPGMFFSPLYPLMIAAAMKVDDRFAESVRCFIETDDDRGDPNTCKVDARPMHVLHALFLTLAVLSIGWAAGTILSWPGAFYAAGTIATVGIVAEAELFSFVMTESVWLGLYSLLMLVFVLALKSCRIRDFAAAGGILGILCLTRPSYLAIVPILLGVIPAYAWCCRGRQARTVRNVAAVALAFAIVVTPWLVRNAVSVGKLRFTEEYGSAALIERFAYNDMTAREFALAFPYCVPVVGPAAVKSLFGKYSMARFQWNHEGSFFYAGRAHRVELWATHGSLDRIIGGLVRDEMRQNWWRHLVTSIPLAWCGIWVSGLFSLILAPLFAWACFVAARERNMLFFAYALPALLLIGLHGVIGNHYSRYNLGLIGPFALGAALVMLRATASRRSDEMPAPARVRATAAERRASRVS